MFASRGIPSVFLGGQNGMLKGAMYPNLTDFVPRLEISYGVPNVGLVFAPLLAAYWLLKKKAQESVPPKPLDINVFFGCGGRI